MGGVRLSPADSVGYTRGNMKDDPKNALLPEGLHDDLPPFAGHESRTIERLVAGFEGHGYQRVKPPLVEFEESLLSGPGAGVSRHMFRLMDPISQRMMGLRADMTTQVARIAGTRLRKVPRPLRLCYAGQVLRVRGTQLRPERQYAQCGVELIGADSPAADAEVVLLAVEALSAVNAQGLSVDLTVPSFVPLLAESLGLEPDMAEQVRTALDVKDGAVVAALPADIRGRFEALDAAAGPADAALEALGSLDLPAAAAELLERLRAVVAAVHEAAPELPLTVDPGESRGFEYQSGVSFTLFAKGVRGELGRGGRYQLANGEAATGFTLYMDSVMRAVPAAAPDRYLYLPHGTTAAEAQNLRGKGWRTIQGLEATGDDEAEARRLGCRHMLRGGHPVDLS
jgi:ATP phosphoribosyltransferase regulatory subunit